MTSKKHTSIYHEPPLQIDDIKTAKDDVENDGQPIMDENWQRLSRSVVRKLDMTLIPMVWLLYMFNYLDRNNIASSKLNNIEKDLKLTGDHFNTAVSVLNAGLPLLISWCRYMVMQIPSNMILTRVRPSLYIPIWVLVWSCISAATAAVQNFGQLIALRILLGIAEAPFFPGAYYLLSCWYTKKELGLRIAILYSGLVVATAVSGLIAAGVFARLDNARGLAGWKWLYIIEGAISFVLGLIAIVILPDFPESTTGSQKWLLTEDERIVALERIQADQIAQESNRSIWYGLKLAISDYRTWAFVFMLICNHAAYGFNYFYPAIVKGFGFGSNTVTLLCTAPPYLLGAILSFVISWSSDRKNERALHIALPMCTAIVGFIISVSTINGPARYVASLLCGKWIGLFLGCGCAEPDLREKAVATSMINVIAQLGNIMSPYFFRGRDEPRYALAMILLIAFASLSAITCVFLKWELRRANRRIADESVNSQVTPRFFTT
ncbi:major facilitator superfamily domain-containing protein [Penicillium canescens]|nr:major facilitator superfamily domain-containing protein [Penicillium canescens]